MCGLCGLVAQRATTDGDARLIGSMCALIEHRGPDDSGLWRGRGAVLGHRRLSIIDLPTGRQPMSTPDGTLTVVFNGEIYNYRELRDELRSHGHPFLTESDTEVLLHGHRHFGPDFVNKLNGMFAYAIWDDEERSLFAARDRLGKKPLYYWDRGGELLFASELKCLLACGELGREIDPEAVDKLFSFGFVPAPTTILRGVAKLPPGHALRWRGGTVETAQYWDVAFVPDHALTPDAAADRLHELLLSSVAYRMISDVPLGAFLSGGIDSSVVVASMAQLAGVGVKTFTIDFAEQGYSEAADARLVAEAARTEHHTRTVKSDAVELLPDLVWHLDEPFADSSALPTWHLSRHAREQVTVALSGDGGDELFAGYDSYRERRAFARHASIPATVRKKVAAPIAEWLPFDAPGKYFLRELGRIEEVQALPVAELFPPIKAACFGQDFRASLAKVPPPESAFRRWGNIPQKDPTSRLQYLDTKVFLPEDILTKVDRMSMAHSLETRAPLLDYRIVEFAATIPSQLHFHDGRGKYVLRKVAARLLPPTVVEKKKQGFAIPRGEWLRGPLKGFLLDHLTSTSFRQRGYFDNRMVARIFEAHQKGRRDYSMWLWCLLCFELWHRTFIDASSRRI